MTNESDVNLDNFSKYEKRLIEHFKQNKPFSYIVDGENFMVFGVIPKTFFCLDLDSVKKINAHFGYDNYGNKLGENKT